MTRWCPTTSHDKDVCPLNIHVSLHGGCANGFSLQMRTLSNCVMARLSAPPQATSFPSLVAPLNTYILEPVPQYDIRLGTRA